jgi:hypothetical protein
LEDNIKVDLAEIGCKRVDWIPCAVALLFDAVQMAD